MNTVNCPALSLLVVGGFDEDYTPPIASCFGAEFAMRLLYAGDAFVNQTN